MMNKDEQIIQKAMRATMAMNETDVIRMIVAMKSIRWAMESVGKPLAADWNDVGFRKIVQEYYAAEMSMMGGLE